MVKVMATGTFDILHMGHIYYLKEAKKYDLIDGIYDELVMAENKTKGIRSEWKRF